ncbi:hypothetical protein [Streptosporangium roseum]|uniref:hypothetical protein n=1 Tax=Streptosporangium roseum TaxID=2001 RepID=UPI0012DE9B60|nr:hypothetical protein [Streptosporangium roseum]
MKTWIVIACIVAMTITVILLIWGHVRKKTPGTASPHTFDVDLAAAQAARRAGA